MSSEKTSSWLLSGWSQILSWLYLWVLTSKRRGQTSHARRSCQLGKPIPLHLMAKRLSSKQHPRVYQPLNQSVFYLSPYLQIVKHLEAQFSRFLKIWKKIHIHKTGADFFFFTQKCEFHNKFYIKFKIYISLEIHLQMVLQLREIK